MNLRSNHGDRLDLIHQILEAANGGSDVTKTNIAYKIFLSYHTLKQYLRFLTENNLLLLDYDVYILRRSRLPEDYQKRS